MNYKSKLLISQPASHSDFFKQSVILIAEHDDGHGAWGVMLNRPLQKVKLKSVLEQVRVTYSNKDISCYLGGPVEQNAIHLVHTNDVQMPNSHIINSNISVTSSVDLFNLIEQGEGPKQWICTLGMSTWAPGQLEGEMGGQHPWTPTHKWLTADCPTTILDTEPKMLWKQSVAASVKEATANLF